MVSIVRQPSFPCHLRSAIVWFGDMSDIVHKTISGRHAMGVDAPERLTGIKLVWAWAGVIVGSYLSVGLMLLAIYKAVEHLVP